MSHFSVAVITEKPDEVDIVLEPFNENLEIPPYVELTKKETVEKSKEEILDKIKNIQKIIQRGQGTDWHEKTLLNYQNLEAWTDEDYYKDYIKCNYFDNLETLKKEGIIDEKGNIWSTYNPNSKWDWYVEGGRFSEMLKIKNKKEFVNQALVKEVDFGYVDKDLVLETGEYWDFAMNNEITNPIYPNKEYLIKTYDNKEEYIKEMTSFRTYAILTPEGKWYEPGKMLYFGVSSADKKEKKDFFNKYFKMLDINKYKNCYITIVDCHI